jgi:PAS domain-containing protein
MIWIWFALVVMLTTFLVLMSRRVGQARARLGRMESRLAAVLAGPDAGLSVWDPDGRLVGFNPRFKEFYPDAPLKPGLVFEDLIRYTVNRGLVRIPGDDSDDEVERWVSEQVGRFGTPSHEVLRTPDGRWLNVYTRSTDAGEVLLVYSDITEMRETEASVIDRSHQLDRHTADLQLLADVIHAGQEASFESAAAQMVEHVCAWSTWPVGFVYRVGGTGAGDSVRLDIVASRYGDPDDTSRFARLRALVEDEPRDGDGVAGRAHKTGRVVWVPNVSVDPAVDPDRLSVMTGIRGACAVPVILDGQVVAVLEFLSSDQLTPDPMTTRLLEATAQMLASVLTSRNAA